MKFRNTLILLVIMGLLLGYVLLVERKADPPPEADASPVPTLLPHVLTFDSAAAREVHLARPERDQLTSLVYGAGGLWTLTQPVVDEADQLKVTRLVESLSQLRPQRALTGTVGALADYDLDPPLITADVILEGGKRHTLSLGGQNAAKSAYYCLVSGDDTLYMVASYIGADIERLLNTPPVKPTPTPEAQSTLPPRMPPPPTPTQ